MDTLLEELNQMGKKVIFLGDGVPVFREKIQEMCQVPYLFAPGHVSRQRAGAVAALENISRIIFGYLRQKGNGQNA